MEEDPTVAFIRSRDGSSVVVETRNTDLLARPEVNYNLIVVGGMVNSE
jgi:hypothetical protein